MANRPWRGRDYDTTRLLLLGESAYSWRDARTGEVRNPSGTHAIELVREALDRFETATAFVKVLTRGLAAEESPSAERIRAAWDGMAFINYVPGSVGDGARQRPSGEMWTLAKEAFPALLGDLTPRTVVVLGKTMWGQMPECDLWLTDDVQGYRLQNGSVAMCWAINHPSAGLSWRRLADVIRFACRTDWTGVA